MMQQESTVFLFPTGERKKENRVSLLAIRLGKSRYVKIKKLSDVK